MDSILARCDPITTYEDAVRPVFTPILPIKGLRRDASGALTKDSIQTILEGLKAYGLAGPLEQVSDAILTEAKGVLCTLHGQYTFLLDSFLTEIARTEPVKKSVLAMILEKNRQMQDVISLCQQVLATAPVKEGFASTSPFQKAFTTQDLKMRLQEGFQIMFSELQTDSTIIEKQQYFDLKKRRYEDSKEQNRFVDRQLGLYAFLNLFGIALFFYIVSYT